MILDILLAFLVCGFFCFIAQIILDNTSLTMGHITSLFVVIGAILEFFNIYDLIRNISFVGASMPISSFGSIIMKGVKEAVENEGIIGIFSGVFNNCGTIISFALFLAFLSAIFFKPKS